MRCDVRCAMRAAYTRYRCYCCNLITTQLPLCSAFRRRGNVIQGPAKTALSKMYSGIQDVFGQYKMSSGST